MSDLRPFTMQSTCDKCGNQSFAWKWIAALPEGLTMLNTQQAAMLMAEPQLSQQEHLRLTCLLCGHAFAMRTKDAT